jgi:hypothetical protein
VLGEAPEMGAIFMNEQDILNASYTLLEQDSTHWGISDDEYLTGRTFLNMGIGRWEQFENTTWRELWKMNSDASSTLGGDATTTTAHDYNCPSDMDRPGGYVTTGTATHTFWEVTPPEKVEMLANSDKSYCFFTGSQSAGFTLHFNPRVTMTTGQAIDYPYYKKADTSTATSFVPEMSDPYYLAYFVAAHMSEEGVNADLFNMAEEKLDNMRTENMSGYWGVPNLIDEDGSGGLGFGGGGAGIVNSQNPTGR